MFRSRSATAIWLIVALFLSGCAAAAAAGSSDEALLLAEAGPAAELDLSVEPGASPQEAGLTAPMGGSGIQVRLSAPYATTSWDARDPDGLKFDIPLLYLHREREATSEADRTLYIEVAGLPADAEIQIEAISRHTSSPTAERHTAVTRFVTRDRPCTPEDPCAVEWTLDAATTLSDFYALRVKNRSGDVLWSNPYPERPDFVALDTWDVRLGDYTVRIYYAALFPFARGEKHLAGRLPTAGVTDFIEYVFAPIIADTWRTQFHEWGFGDRIHPDWDRDRVVEVFITAPPYALFDGTGLYTVLHDGMGNPYPERRIWWPASNYAFEPYDLLPNGYKVVFAHEFFHLVQWNTLLGTGRPTNFSKNVFIEGQGRFVPSVLYPEIEIEERHVVLENSAYGRAANLYLPDRLNISYKDREAERVFKYDAALYWRFLYEQYNDMEVVRAALEEMALYLGPDITASMGRIMNQTFARLDGPFHTYEESLIAFARANYALRLENGRCTTADLTACGGFYYDPQSMYTDPPLEAELDYQGTQLTFGDAIPVSYGMSFIEVTLDPSLQNQPLTIKLQGEGAGTRFNVQIWKLGSGEAKPRAVSPQADIVPQTDGGEDTYIIPQIDTTAYDRLALIITRLDSNESLDLAGNYRITLKSATEAGDDGDTVQSLVTYCLRDRGQCW